MTVTQSGDRLPFGANVFPGHKANDTVLWVESQHAVISGDVLATHGGPTDRAALERALSSS